MSRRIDLADPSFEPTDEELTELSKRAFGHLKQEHADAAARLREEMRREREAALEYWGPRLRAVGKAP